MSGHECMPEWCDGHSENRAEEMRAELEELRRKINGDLPRSEPRHTTLQAVINEVFTIADAYVTPAKDDPYFTYCLGQMNGLSQARFAVLRGLGVFPPNHVEYVPKPEVVYIAETIFFEDNVVDGRTREGVFLSLEEALDALREEEEDPNLKVSLMEDSALHGEGGRTWAVHKGGDEPDDFGHLWITEEKLA